MGDGAGGMSQVSSGGLSSSGASSNLRLWRRRYVTVFSLLGGVLVLAMLVEMLILNHLDGRGWSLLGVALVVAPAVLLVVVAVVSWKVRLRGSFRTLCEVGSPAEVRAVSRALLRNEPVPAGGAAIAQVVVDRNVRATAKGRRRYMLPYGVLAAVFVGEFFIQHSWWRWLYLVGAAGYLAGAVLSQRGSTRLTTNAASQGIHPTAVPTPPTPGTSPV